MNTLISMCIVFALFWILVLTYIIFSLNKGIARIKHNAHEACKDVRLDYYLALTRLRKERDRLTRDVKSLRKKLNQAEIQTKEIKQLVSQLITEKYNLLNELNKSIKSPLKAKKMSKINIGFKNKGTG